MLRAVFGPYFDGTPVLFVRRGSDLFVWNANASPDPAYEASPASLDAEIEMIEGTGIFAGIWVASVPGLGSPDDVVTSIHNKDDSYAVIGEAQTSFVKDDNEQVPGLLGIADAVLDEAVAGAFTLRQLCRGFASALLSKLSGAEPTSGTVILRDINDTKAVITAVKDQYGNRITVTLDLS